MCFWSAGELFFSLVAYVRTLQTFPEEHPIRVNLSQELFNQDVVQWHEGFQQLLVSAVSPLRFLITVSVIHGAHAISIFRFLRFGKLMQVIRFWGFLGNWLC